MVKKKSPFRNSRARGASPQPGYHPLDLKQESNSNPSSAEMDGSTFQQLQQLPGNDTCIDCGTKSPDWGSPNLGILFCFHCSGVHRGLGTHLSFVRSIHMDAWTSRQVALMHAGGNQKCQEFLAKHGVAETGRETIRAKYSSPAAQLYQQVLVAQLDGTPIPTELPASSASTNNNTQTTRKKKMEGFGSAPLPNESPSSCDYTSKVLCVAVPAVAGVVLW